MSMDKVSQYRGLAQDAQGWMGLRQMAVAKNPDQDLTLSELDKNGDNKLNDKEVDPAVSKSPSALAELKKKFEQAKAAKAKGLSEDPVVISGASINTQLAQIAAAQQELVRPMQNFFATLHESVSGRKALDVINQNNEIPWDKQIDRDDLKVLKRDLDEQGIVKNLIAKIAADPETKTKLDPAILEDLPVYIESLKGKTEETIKTENPELDVDYGFDSFGEPYETFDAQRFEDLKIWDTEYAQGQSEHTLLKQKQPLNETEAQRYQELTDSARFYREVQGASQQKILKACAHDPQVKALLGKLDKMGIGGLETLEYIHTLVTKPHGKETLKQLNLQFDSLMKSPQCKLSQSERLTLIQDILNDVTFPQDIGQREKGTCGATALQTKLAILDPVKYTKICLSLALERPFSLGQGESLRHNHTYRLESADKDSRSLSCKIMQNAFMDFGRSHGSPDRLGKSVVIGGEKVYFDSRTNVGHDIKEKEKRFAMIRKENPDLADLDDETLRSLGASFSEYAAQELGSLLMEKVVSVENDPFSPDDMIKLIDQKLAQGKRVDLTVTMTGNSLHSVLVTGKDTTQTPPVYIINTWRGLYHRTAEQMERFILSARK